MGERHRVGALDRGAADVLDARRGRHRVLRVAQCGHEALLPLEVDPPARFQHGNGRPARGERRDGAQVHVEVRAQAAGQVDQHGVAAGLEGPQRLGVRGVGEVGGAKQQALVAAVETAPQQGVDRHADQRGVDDPGREVVEVEPELAGLSGRVLVVAVSQLVGGEAGQARHEHAVVVDEAEVAARGHEDVAVLEVAVGHAGAAQLVDESGEASGEIRQRGAVPQVLFDVGKQRLALRPVHLHDREPLAPDEHAALLELEADAPRAAAWQSAQVLVQLAVAAVHVVEPADEAAHRPRPPVVGLHAKDAGEVAAHRTGKAQGREVDGRPGQRRIGERARRVLQGLHVGRAAREGAGGRRGVERRHHSTSIRTIVTSSLRNRPSVRSPLTHCSNAAWPRALKPWSCCHGARPASTSDRNHADRRVGGEHE